MALKPGLPITAVWDPIKQVLSVSTATVLNSLRVLSLSFLTLSLCLSISLRVINQTTLFSKTFSFRSRRRLQSIRETF